MVVVVVVGSSPPSGLRRALSASSTSARASSLSSLVVGEVAVAQRLVGLVEEVGGLGEERGDLLVDRALGLGGSSPGVGRRLLAGGQVLVEHVGQRLEERGLDRHRALVVDDHEPEARAGRVCVEVT